MIDTASKPQSISEFLASCPIGSRITRELCAKHGIDLNSPWPPQFPKSSDETAATVKQGTAQLILFPEWSDSRRAAPSAAFRSALFPALGRQKRRKLWDEQIYGVKGVTVLFRGEQFDQSDLDVYLEILHLMRDQPNEVEFTAYGLLKALGRPTGKKDYIWLHSVIIRLTAGTVDMTSHMTRYFGHLIEGGERDEVTKKYVLSVNPKFARMFKAAWSTVDIQQRRALKSDTAKALHAYYSSHINPGLHGYDTLAGIAGLTNKHTGAMHRTILKAHKELEEIGFLLDYEPTKEGIKVKATMTPSQTRAAVKKASRKPRKT